MRREGYSSCLCGVILLLAPASFSASMFSFLSAKIHRIFVGERDTIWSVRVYGGLRSHLETGQESVELDDKNKKGGPWKLGTVCSLLRDS